MPQILLVRHGETEWNAAQRVQGWMDTPLSDKGRVQAACLTARLRSTSVTAVYSSDLSRAQETAEILSAPHGLPVVQDRRLRERSYGKWEGLTLAEVAQHYPEEWDRYHRQRRLDVDIPGAETWGQVSERILPYFEILLKDHPDPAETVLIVGHGGSLRLLLLHALAAPLPVLLHLHLDNASLSRLRYRTPADGRLLLLNDTSHLFPESLR